MSKKLVILFLACTAALAFAGGAWATPTTVELREGGASAQGDFINQNAGEYLKQELTCDPVCRNSIPGDNTSFIIKGVNCEFDNDGAGDDTVVIKVQGIGSSFGCANAPGSQVAPGYIDEATCDFSAGAGCTSGIVKVLNNCAAPKIDQRLHVGCSDIQCASLIQTTTGYNDGRKGFLASQPVKDFGDSDGFPPTSISPTADMALFSPFIVPFSYIANDRVTKTRCTAPLVTANALNDPDFGTCVAGACDSGVRQGQGCSNDKQCPITGDLVWDFYGAQCVPGSQRCLPKDPVPDPPALPGTCDVTGDDCALSTQYQLNPARFLPGQSWLQAVPNSCPPVAGAGSGDPASECVGFYKCVGDERTSPTDPADQRTCVGGTRAGLACDTPTDCPADRAETKCEARPIDNLSRMQALLLFAGQIKNWQDFGPWYPDLAVALCLRHGGSGTHGTKDLRIMRGDRAFLTQTRAYSATDPTGNAIPSKALLPIAWHYKSSTTLTEDCVEFYDGGVGYVDADKVMNNDFTSNVHHVKTEGVEPVRQKVIFGEYPFWGAASCFFDKDTAAGLSAAQQTLATNLLNWIATQNERFEFPTNLFWATGAEMTVAAPNDFAYPSK